MRCTKHDLLRRFARQCGHSGRHARVVGVRAAGRVVVAEQSVGGATPREQFATRSDRSRYRRAARDVGNVAANGAECGDQLWRRRRAQRVARAAKTELTVRIAADRIDADVAQQQRVIAAARDAQHARVTQRTQPLGRRASRTIAKTQLTALVLAARERVLAVRHCDAVAAAQLQCAHAKALQRVDAIGQRDVLLRQSEIARAPKVRRIRQHSSSCYDVVFFLKKIGPEKS